MPCPLSLDSHHDDNALPAHPGFQCSTQYYIGGFLVIRLYWGIPYCTYTMLYPFFYTLETRARVNRLTSSPAVVWATVDDPCLLVLALQKFRIPFRIL